MSKKNKRAPSKRKGKRSGAWKRRSDASKRGWATRRLKAIGKLALTPFADAVAAGAPHREIRKLHKTWRKVQGAIRLTEGEAAWESILDAIGDELGLDDDFVDALLESPDVPTEV